jgi:hypothetical protein
MEPDAVVAFVDEVIGSGVAWSEIVRALLDGLEDGDPWPGEDPVAVLHEMLVGTVALELRHVPDGAVREATRLIARANARVRQELRLAAEVAGRRAAMRSC